MTGDFYSSDIGLFGKTKTSVQLNRLENLVDRSIVGGGDRFLQSLMVLHLSVMEFLLQIMVTSKDNMKFYEMTLSGENKWRGLWRRRWAKQRQVLLLSMQS
ncbi:hypothetical protein YC2023_025653 [Brassica napus]